MCIISIYMGTDIHVYMESVYVCTCMCILYINLSFNLFISIYKWKYLIMECINYNFCRYECVHEYCMCVYVYIYSIDKFLNKKKLDCKSITVYYIE